ncbi:unnamed protein product [Cylindrotheca closterium]|uniref:Peptidase S1 domain-containing protein n=1 Tax=Cylindrotheca closterium TaxID=2856 RepID=A0AAD2FXY2_9STRA|nr:unnamed protein product [Cylindrotheca closterium]
MIGSRNPNKVMKPNGNEQQQQQDNTATETRMHHSTLRRTAEWMGYPRIAPQPRIVNGIKAPDPDRYPYFVALVDDRDRIVCGGSLIASNVVLSAAHCGLTNLKFAIVGKYHGQIDVQHNEAERIPIVDTYSNPRFTLSNRSHDQLLVLLESPASATRPVVRLNLLQGGGDAALPVLTDRVTVLGLGQTYSSTQQTQDPPKVLQQVTMGVVSNRQCQEMYDEYEFFVPKISNDMICLLESAKGQCYGDSGSPYILLGETPEDDVQIGTVAWGIDCAREEYPAVGIRTFLEDDSFLSDTVCSIAVNPPSYFGCPTLAPQPAILSPTISPSAALTSDPTVSPSKAPTIAPTVMASDFPTRFPSSSPTIAPTVMASDMPTRAPSSSPTKSPSATPTVKDSDRPTASPSISPTKLSSEGPSSSPSLAPSSSPTVVSSRKPSSPPSIVPSEMPSTPFPTSSPITCVARANSCTTGGDVCCGTDVCQGGFCRLIPSTSKQSGYKNDLKLTRATNSGVRGGSFQSVGIAIPDSGPEEP